MMHDSAIDAKARAYIHMACIEEIKDFGDRVEDWEDRGKRNKRPGIQTQVSHGGRAKSLTLGQKDIFIKLFSSSC